MSISSGQMTLREVAAATGLSEGTVRTAVRSGELPAVRGQRGRYEARAEDVALWLAERPHGGLDAAVARVVAAAPALTATQRTRLVAVLGGGAS